MSDQKEDAIRLRAPYPLRMEPEVRRRAQAEANRIDRSLHWVINDKLKQAFGLKEAA